MSHTTASLLASFNYFEALFNKTEENNVLLLDAKGTVIMVNDAFTRCFGYGQGDIVGKSVAVLFTEEDRSKGKPQKEIKDVLSKGQAYDNNYLVAKDKTVTWVSGESVLVENTEGQVTILKIIQDIHAQKKSEISLNLLHQFNEDILGAIEDVVIVLDEQMNILKANRAFYNVFPDTDPGVKVTNFAELIRPYDSFGELEKHIQNAIANNIGFSNVPIDIDATNQKRTFDVNCSPMNHSSGEKNVLLVIHDITIHKKVEREREDVIGFVAHELRNPLANLVLCNDLMGEAVKENDEEGFNDMLQRSKNNVSRLNKMISELYDATRINSGNLKLDISTFNFKEMIKEAIGTVQVLHPSYEIVVEGDGDIDVNGDRYRLIQVVTNYLSNGIKYSGDNTGVILKMHYDDKKMTVAVQDEGLGISPNQLPYIFERFFRAEKTKNLEGIGLGLYLCRQIIHSHKGQVWAESEEGKGSTFYFSIPLM